MFFLIILNQIQDCSCCTMSLFEASHVNRPLCRHLTTELSLVWCNTDAVVFFSNHHHGVCLPPMLLRLPAICCQFASVSLPSYPSLTSTNLSGQSGGVIDRSCLRRLCAAVRLFSTPNTTLINLLMQILPLLDESRANCHPILHN